MFSNFLAHYAGEYPESVLNIALINNSYPFLTYSYSECANEHIPYRCEVGDLVHKHDRLRVSGRKRDLKNTVKFFTDSNLPLSGRHSIIGRSITIHDDFAPEHRGNRMACTGIYRAYRHKAVASSWFGNGQTIPVKGRLEFIQASPMDPTHVLVDLHGLNGAANAYHVHQVLLYVVI